MQWLLSGRFVALVCAVSIGIWLVMVMGTLPHLQQIAGGLAPFDVRPGGYTADEAQAILTALGAGGRDFYLNVQLRIDSIYPSTYYFSRALLLWWLAGPGRVMGGSIPMPLRYLLLVAPFVAMTADYLENQGITAMLGAVTPDADLIVRTSVATQIKSLGSLVAESSVLVLGGVALGRWVWRRSA